MGKAKCNSSAHTRLSPYHHCLVNPHLIITIKPFQNLVNPPLERLKAEDNQVRMSLHLSSSKSSDGPAVLVTGCALLWDTGVPCTQADAPSGGCRAGPKSVELKSRGGKNSSALGSRATPTHRYLFSLWRRTAWNLIKGAKGKQFRSTSQRLARAGNSWLLSREDKDISMVRSLALAQLLRHIKSFTEQSLFYSSQPAQHEATLACSPAKITEEL